MVSLILTLALTMLVPQARSDKGDVESTSAKGKNFAAFRTYTWDKGHEAYDPAAHKLIVAAIDKEMSALGFTRAEAGKADVMIRYHTVVSTFVDFKSLQKAPVKAADGSDKTAQLGTLVVEMVDPAHKQLWAARTREFVEPSTLEQSIGPVVARLFQTYPGRTAKPR
jgi:hypothetical protein